MSIFSDLNAQNNLPVRKAAVAGQFYPGDAEALEKYFEKEFNQITIAPNDKKVRAIIVPHAGYMYSGTRQRQLCSLDRDDAGGSCSSSCD